MRALQILFIISFAIFALVFPYIVFSFMQGQENNNLLIIFLAVIFAINAVFIGRKLLSLKNS